MAEKPGHHSHFAQTEYKKLRKKQSQTETGTGRPIRERRTPARGLTVRAQGILFCGIGPRVASSYPRSGIPNLKVRRPIPVVQHIRYSPKNPAASAEQKLIISIVGRTDTSQLSLRAICEHEHGTKSLAGQAESTRCDLGRQWREFRSFLGACYESRAVFVRLADGSHGSLDGGAERANRQNLAWLPSGRASRSALWLPSSWAL